MPSLSNLGWNPLFESEIEPFTAEGLLPGRVAMESHELYRIYTAGGEVLAEISGRLRHEARSREDLPAVGDWVAVRQTSGDGRAVIHAVLPRRSRLARKEAGRRAELQIVAANVDTVFVVTSLNRDFNPRRLERALALVWESGASPVVVLTKADLCDDVDALVREAEDVALAVPVVPVSVVAKQGLDALRSHIAPGRTAVLVGSSGVGKSTLANCLLGAEAEAVRDIRADDDRGRHTTTRRHLLLLPGGGVLIDTPGIRELQLGGDEDVSQVFADVERLAAECRFRDCTHRGEPDCAVRGTVDSERLASYEKLRREARYAELRQEHTASFVEKRRWKKVMAAHARTGRITPGS